MHPLSTFPDLLSFVRVAPLLLRVCVSLFILFLGWKVSKTSYKWAAIIYVISGVMLILGFYTQIASIIGILVLKFDFWKNKKTRAFNINEKILYGIFTIILLSLLVTGPGFLSLDLPL